MTTNPSHPSRGPLLISPLRRLAALALVLLLTLVPDRPASALTGGPDAFGYTFTDTASGGITYNFENISGTGTVAATVSNALDAKQAIPVGFSFNYYGTSYTTCDIATHGYIGFNDFGGALPAFNNVPLPNSGGPNEIIAGWWDDQNPGVAGDIFYQTLGTAPNRRLIIQYQAVVQSNSANTNTYQFKLFEGSNRIEVHYAALSVTATATIGIENAAGSVGLQYFNGAGIPPVGVPFAVRFSPTRVINNSDSGFGSLRQAIADLPPGGSAVFAPAMSGQTIVLTSGQLALSKNLTIDASGLPDGLTISGNNASRVVFIPVGNTVTLDTLTITGGGGPAGGGGGGIRNDGTLFLNRCTVSGNTVPAGNWGGGILNAGGTLNATNCTVVNNSAEVGGGIFSDGTGTLSHLTITNNTAPSGGGGLWMNGGAITIHNTIIAENTPQDAIPAGASVLNQTGVNLIGGDPKLAPLGNYGGPNRTRHPLSGSPAIDPAGGATTSPLATDQRGRVRVIDGNNNATATVDIGAVEAGPIQVVTSTADAGAGTLRQAILNTDFVGHIIFDSGLNGGTIVLAGEIPLAKRVDIDATSLAAGITIDGGPGTNRIFSLNSVANLTLRSLTLTGGNGTGALPNGIGGAIYSVGGTLTLDRCTLTGNTAIVGGAIMCYPGTATLNQCTISGNSASQNAGAIYNYTNTLTLTQCTLSGNTGSDGGGAITNDGGTLALSQTIIAGNSINSGLGPEIWMFSGTLIPTGQNFIGNTAGSTLAASATILTGNALLSPLGNHGGATRTLHPLPGSPVTDPAAGATTSAFATDQRGDVRVADGNNPADGTATLDIGAVESGPVRQVTNAAASGAGSLTQALTDVDHYGSVIFAAGLDGTTITPASELVLNRNVSINAGNLASGITLSGNNANRVIRVAAGVTATLNRVAIIAGQQSGGYGAGIQVDGTATLTDCWISGNSAFVGAGAYVNGAAATLTLNRCTISGNTASVGGGIQNEGRLIANSSTFSGNTASQNSGAISSPFNRPVTLTHCTVSGNSATTSGGAATGSNLSIGNSIVAGNTAAADPNIAGTPVLTGTNLTSGDPLLSPLGSYGGPTRTRPPQALSPAINASTASTATADQRGCPVVGSAPDIGAAECSILDPTPRQNGTANRLAPTLGWNGPGGAGFQVFIGTTSGSLGAIGAPAPPPGDFSAFRGQNGLELYYTVTGSSSGSVWGTNVYTDDSNLATAAVHAGIVDPGETAAIKVVIMPGQSAYPASTQNGVTSFAFGSWSGSYRLEPAVAGTGFPLTSQLAPGLKYWRVDSTIGGVTFTGPEFTFNVLGVSNGNDSGAGSLRQALADAAANPGADTVLYPDSMNRQTITLADELVVDDPGGVVVDASALAGGLTINGGTGTNRLMSVAAGSILTLRNLTFTGGDGTGSADSGNGGAIYNDGNTTLEGCALHANTATGNGGAIYNNGTLALTLCTLAGNKAATWGGAIQQASGGVTVTRSTIAGNYCGTGGAGGIDRDGGSITLNGSIVAGNSGNAGQPNIFGSFDGTGNLTAGDPRLSPLGNFGGPTPTLHPLVGSPAIDPAGGAGSSTLPVDQRGFPRLIDGNGDATATIDIGAVEVGPALRVNSSSDSTATGRLRWAINNSTAPGARIVFNLLSSDSLITLTAGPLAMPANSTVFIDASSLVNGAGNPTTEPDPIRPGATFVPRGVTVSGGGLLRAFDIPGGSTAAMHHVNVTGGSTTGNGGGINNGGVFTLIDSTLSGCNSTYRSGGLFNSGTASLIRCTVSGNQASDLGGGIENTGNLSLVNSTVSGNFASISGGGIYSLNTVSLANSTISDNTAGSGGGITTQNGTLRLVNTIVAGNTGTSLNPDLGQFATNTITSGGGNFIGKNNAVATPFPAGAPNVNGDFAGTNAAPLDPLLGPLADKGGPTFTMAPQAGSPLFNAGNSSGTQLFTDQRGFPRILADALDIGALEAGASDFNPEGLTLFAKVPAAVGNGGTMRFEISTDADFFATADTIAGNGTVGAANGPALASQFNFPSDVAEDGSGNFFIADSGNNRIRMRTPAGVVSTIAGTGSFGLVNGDGPAAKFAFPSGVTVGPDENVYVSDTINHCIRKLTRPALPGLPWTVSTLAGTGIAGFTEGLGTVARFNHPHALAFGPDGSLYVADTLNHRIRKVTPAGVVGTHAGSGTSGFTAGNRLVAKFSSPFGVAADAAGNLFVADTGNQRIRRVDAVDGEVTTIGGSIAGFLNGFGTAARFNTPTGVAVDAEGSLVVADQGNHAVRKVAKPINPADPWETTTVGGTGVAGFADGRTTNTGARFNLPTGLCVAADGRVIVADQRNHRIRRIADPLSIDAFDAGQDSFGLNFAAIINAAALGLVPETTYYFRWVAADGSKQEMGESFTLVPIPTVVTTPATPVTRVAATINGTVDPNGNATTVSFDYSTDPGLLGPQKVATLANGLAGPRGLAVDSGGNVFVAAAASHKILRITPGGIVSDFAGSGTAGFADGTGAAAQFDRPQDLAIDGADNLYVADELNHRIRKITPAGVVSTIAGSGVAGFADAASAPSGRFLFPCGIAVNADASKIHVADRGNQRIRVITGGSLGTLAGDGTAGFLDGPAAASQFNHPTGVAVDGFGNVFVADRDNHRIRVVNTSEEVLTFAGTGDEGFLDGAGSAARFAFPSAVAIDGGGVLYVTDRDNHRLRTIDGFGFVTTLAGSGIAGVLDTPLAGELWPATATRFSSPGNVAVDAASGAIYLTEEGSQRVRKVSRGTLLSITLPGTYSTNGDLNLGTAIPETLVPGATYYFRVRASNSQGPAVGQILSFTTPTEPRIEVSDGIGIAAAAIINAQPVAIDFGVTPLGTPVTRQFTIRNTGGWDLAVTSIHVPAGYRAARQFAEANEPFTIDSFGSFYDTELGLYDASGNLLATNDDVPPEVHSQLNLSSGLPAGTYHVALAGYNTVFANGFLATGGGSGGSYVLRHPGGVEQGTQPSGVVRWFTFQIGSGGGSAVPGAPLGTPISRVIPPGGSMMFVASLEATVGGSFDGNVEITSDDPEQGSFIFPVTGVVKNPPGVITLAATDTVSDTPTSTFSSTFNGTINPEGSDTTAWFEYSPDPEFDGLQVTVIAGAGDGYAEGTGVAALFNQPSGLAADASGNIYVADTLNHRIRIIAPDGSSGTFAGTGVAGFAEGPAASAQFNQPAGLAIGSDGTLFVADSLNHVIRAISPGGEVTTYCGLGTPGHTDGVAGAARFNTPKGLAIDAAGNLYVADVVNQYIRKVATDGSASTLTDTFGQPAGIAASADGTVYFSVSNIIRRIQPGGVTGDFAGDDFSSGHVNASGAAARFSNPAGLALDASGNLLVADRNNHRVRKVAPDGTVTAFAGTGVQGTVDGSGEEARFDNPFSLAVDALGDVISGNAGQSTLRRIAPTRVLVQVATGLTGDTAIPVSYLASGLELGTTYYFRVIATNFVGTTVGNTLNVSGEATVQPRPFQIWQAAEFGPDAGNPLIAGQLANPTNDGVANLLKYALFLDPNVASQAGLPVMGLAGGTLTLTYTKVLSATDLNYVVECSTDLITWSSAGVTLQDIGGNTVTRQIRASAPVAGIPAKFIRLNVTLQQP